MKHLFLLFSITLIAAYWAWLCTLYLLGLTIGSLTGAREIALHISAVTLVESTIIWLLLRGSGERPTHLLTRFEQGFGTSGLVLAIITDSVLFGLGHSYQGAWGATQAGLMGLTYSVVFLRRRRVADAMLAHTAYDLIGISSLYSHYAQRG